MHIQANCITRKCFDKEDKGLDVQIMLGMEPGCFLGTHIH